MEGSASEVKRKAKVLDSIFEIEQKYGSVTLLGEKKKYSSFLHCPGLNKTAGMVWESEKSLGFGTR